MQLGKLEFTDVKGNLEQVAETVRQAIKQHQLEDVYVSEIDPGLADTAAFCEQYGIGLEISANCVVVEAKRGDRVWYAACMVLATDKIDVNGVVRKFLDARKISFAPMDKAVSLSKMEYGGITPIGLPEDWPILVDNKIMDTKRIIIGSGIRSSKLYVPGHLLEKLPKATVINLTK